MSEIEFACPQCRQQLACDANYLGLRVTCPACQTELVVPSAVETKAQQMNMNTVRSSAALYPKPKDESFWTEEQWRQQIAELGQGRADWSWASSWGFFWCLLLAPAVAVLAINLFIKPVLGPPRELGLRDDLSIGMTLLNGVLIASIFTSIYCGFTLAARLTEKWQTRALSGVFLSLLFFVINFILFGAGCAFRTS